MHVKPRSYEESDYVKGAGAGAGAGAARHRNSQKGFGYKGCRGMGCRLVCKV